MHLSTLCSTEPGSKLIAMGRWNRYHCVFVFISRFQFRFHGYMNLATACTYRILPPRGSRGTAVVIPRPRVASSWLHWLAVHITISTILTPSHPAGLTIIRYHYIPSMGAVVCLSRQHTWWHWFPRFSRFSISAFQSLKFDMASIPDVSGTPGGTPGGPAPTSTPAAPGEHLSRFS